MRASGTEREPRREGGRARGRTALKSSRTLPPRARKRGAASPPYLALREKLPLTWRGGGAGGGCYPRREGRGLAAAVRPAPGLTRVGRAREGPGGCLTVRVGSAAPRRRPAGTPLLAGRVRGAGSRILRAGAGEEGNPGTGLWREVRGHEVVPAVVSIVTGAGRGDLRVRRPSPQTF